MGDWQAVAANPASSTISFTATGSNSKTTPGTFGIHISYTPVSPQPNNLPNSSPQPLNGGSIKLT